MTLKEYEAAVLASRHDDWTWNACWGAFSGPSYLNKFTVWTKGSNEFSNLEVDSHSVVGSLKSNLSIYIAYGLSHNDDFVEDWANQFPDSHASSSFVDFFYNNQLVFRDIYVCVDGGRCMLPLPRIQYKVPGGKERELYVPTNKYTFFSMLEEQNDTFERYFEESKIQIADDELWMS